MSTGDKRKSVQQETLAPVAVGNIRATQQPDMIGKKVALTVRIQTVGEITASQVGGQLVNTLADISVIDRNKDTLPLLNVTGERADRIINAQKLCREIGITAEVALDGTGHYTLSLVDIDDSQCSCRLIGVSASERTRAEELLKRARAREISLLTHIEKQIEDILSIQGLTGNPILAKAIRTQILASVSKGAINGTPAMIHSLLISPPGHGKGLVGRAGSILNPVSVRISSNSITPAGLVGTSQKSHGITHVEVGKLAQANTGVAILEDLQHISTDSYRHTYGILCDMMEMGRLIRTTWRDVDIPVETALLADVNPKSTVRPDAPANAVFLEDLGVPVNFLSRVDVVLCFPRDVERQIGTMLSILAETGAVGLSCATDNARVRELRALIAVLRDNCDSVDVSGVADKVREKIEQLLTMNREKLESLTLASDFLLRGAKSVLKLVAASARLHARCVARTEDVGIAFDIFEGKMQFLQLLEPTFRAVENWKGDPDVQKERQRRIMQQFGGRAVKCCDVAKAFVGISSKTLQRDLKQLGATVSGRGVWEVPAQAAR